MVCGALPSQALRNTASSIGSAAGISSSPQSSTARGIRAVLNSGAKAMAEIFYHAVPADWTREEKLCYLAETGAWKKMRLTKDKTALV